MTKAILTTKIDPTYDDLPEERYHFPKTYLRTIEAAVGDWIVYYEPRRSSGQESSRGGRLAYFATARITSLANDPRRADHYYAYVTDYLDFLHAVPFRNSEYYYESSLRHADGRINQNTFRRAVRSLSDDEYERILQAGFTDSLRSEQSKPSSTEIGFQLSEAQLEYGRPIVEHMAARRFRDAAFATSVKSAYRDTCAMTGIRIINGGGRAEVQAAHIRPITDLGPDSVRNGLALSGTLHWMFDRGLVSVNDDHRILIAEKHVPNSIKQLIPADRRLRIPERRDLQPHPAFLQYHRQTFFKG